MRKLYCFIMALMLALCTAQFAFAAEHGGMEHGGMEHGGKTEAVKEHGGEKEAVKEHGGEKAAVKEHGGEKADVEEHREHAGKTHEQEHGGKEKISKEHGGKEHGGKEHGGKRHKKIKKVKPTARNIRRRMKKYVSEQSKPTGTFNIYDSVTDQTLKLDLVRVHKRVGKTGDYYYSCADFEEINTGELYDLDLDVEHKDGQLSVVDVRVHKVGGQERYTYDENDNRIPVSEE